MTERTADEAGLLACPFCGAAGELTDTMPAGTYWVHCSVCDAEGPSSDERTAKDATARWNARTKETRNDPSA